MMCMDLYMFSKSIGAQSPDLKEVFWDYPPSVLPYARASFIIKEDVIWDLKACLNFVMSFLFNQHIT